MAKELFVTTRKIIVDGKIATVYDVRQGDGTWGLHAEKGKRLRVTLHNKTEKPITLHPHGLVLPNPQDGVPGLTQVPVPPGGTFEYDFTPTQSGTFFGHSHLGFEIQELLAAPLILTDPKEAKVAEKDIVMFLADFSFRTPEEIWKNLHKGGAMPDMSAMGGRKPGRNTGKNAMAGMKMDAPDLNDVKYDAFLANNRTLSDPDSYAVKPGTTVRLRIINGAAASNFFIYLGNLKGKLIAVDGSDIEPIEDSTFEIADAQRLDVLVTLPTGEGVYPILAQGEGTDMQAGIILHTPGVPPPKLSAKAAKTAGAIGTGYRQELRLRPKHPLANRKVDRSLPSLLTGEMKGYRWMINGKQYPATDALMVKEGERVELVFRNDTQMSHPMHLHGHVFQVTEIDGKTINGAVRDTVLVMPNSTIKVQFDATNPGLWAMHCHILYHQMAGMMTSVNYEGYPLPDYYRKDFDFPSK